MKTALLHYWLTNMRGGENVFAEIAGLFPDADIFTHAYNQAVMAPLFGSHRITETYIGRMPGARVNCQKYLPLMPSALKRLDLSAYDLIVSSESGPIKGIRKPAKAVHLCYCHTPMRYLWDMYDDYYRQAGIAEKLGMRLFCKYLRRYDVASADCVDLFVANSKFVAERIRHVYHRESTVVYPPVDVSFYSSCRLPKQDYYLLAGQLVSYKHPELAVQACTLMKRRLVVVGTGPMLEALKRIAGPTIEFRGRVSNEELRECYTQARALLFPGIEDFGIVPLEAQAAGTPVIALGKGGALETVVPGQTGFFFQNGTVDGLMDAIREAEGMAFSESACRNQALAFSPDRFRRLFCAVVQKAIAHYFKG